MTANPTTLWDGYRHIKIVDDDQDVVMKLTPQGYLIITGTVSATGSGSGGTEYDEGDTDASITGTAVMGEGPSNVIYPITVDSAGHLQVDILSGGSSGQQYDEGDTAATITGTAMLWEDTGNTLSPISAAKPLPVSIGATVTITATDLDIRDLTTVDTISAVQSGAWAITLPTGASTEAKQDTIEATLTNIETDVSSIDAILTTVLDDNAIGIDGAKYSMQPHFEQTTDWVESAGADNLATTTSHQGAGNNNLTFDKIAGNDTAMISKTISSFDMSAFIIHSIGHMHVYLPDLADIDYVFVRIGTDVSNYHQWNFDMTNASAGWMDLNTPIAHADSQTGVGMDLSAITWIAFGVLFDGADDTLAGIITGGWGIKRVTDMYQTATVITDLNVPNINMIKIASHPVSVNTGNASVGTQRVVIATDQPSVPVTETNSAAIKTAVELIDDAIAGSEMQVDVVAALPAGTNTIGAITVVTLPDVDINDISKGTQTNDIKITLDGEVVTVDGTVIATATNLDIRDLTTNDTISAAQSGTWNITNISGTISLPTGAATEAKQDTIEATLTNIETDINNMDGNITKCDTDSVLLGETATITATDLDIRDLAATQDNILIYANTAKDGSGTDYVPLLDSDGHLQVDLVAMLPAGTNTIGAVSVTTLPDVDINDISKGTQTNDVKVTLDSEAVTETNSAAIKTAVEKIDNQEDSITYAHVTKTTSDGDIIGTPGASKFLRIHHIFVNNQGANTTIFEFEDDTTPLWRFCLAGNGGAIAQNLKRPWDLTANKPLHYDYKTGASAAITITIGYEEIST